MKMHRESYFFLDMVYKEGDWLESDLKQKDYVKLLWISPRLLSDLSGIRPFYPAWPIRLDAVT